MNKESAKLSNISILISRGITPKYTSNTDAVSVINQKCIRDGKINFDLCKKHNLLIKKISSEKFLQKNDILVNSTGVGTLGRVSQISDEISKTTCDSHVTIIRPDKTKIDPNYLGAYLYLNQKKIESLGHGSTGQTELGRLDLGKLEIPNLLDKKQKLIGEFFQYFNEKIKINEKINSTLEEIAAILFKSWFIDFDPVKKKSASFSTGLLNEISDLFPHSFEDSELGSIPQGWKICKVEDLLDFEKIIIKPYENSEEIFYHYSIPAFDDNQTPSKEIGFSIKSNKYLIDENVLLVSKLNPRIPRIWLPSKVKNSRKSISSTEFLVCKPKGNVGIPFIYFLIKSSRITQQMIKMATGTSSSHQRLRPKDFLSMSFIKPDNKLFDLFTKNVSPIFEKYLSIREQNTLLIKCRDNILPKLISGELRISDAEKMIENVGI